MNAAASPLWSPRGGPAARPRECAGAWTSVLAPGHLPPGFCDAWAELGENAAEPNAFAEHWFVQPSLRHLDPPADLRIMAVWASALERPRLIGVLALHEARRYGRMPIRHLQNWTHSHSFLGVPLIRAGEEENFWVELLGFLDRESWARSFVHLKGLVEGGAAHRALSAAAGRLNRPCDTVHRVERAFLESELSPQDYYERNVRKKKRKELKRLSARVAELGRVKLRTLGEAHELELWCDDFLALESSGWKGKAGSALGCGERTERFFREAVAGAFHAGRLDFLRLDLDGRPLSMLVNFIVPPGGFSFKTAIDEEHGRFSPGVLIQIENLRALARPDVAWMDSCAAENHPMINSLWAERRGVVRVSVPLAGPVRRTTFELCRLAERLSASLRAARSCPIPIQQANDFD